MTNRSEDHVRELPDWFEVDRWVPPPGSIENRRVFKLMQKLGFEDYYAEEQRYASAKRD